jgi:BirA family biotin operon repressor/biotin-[acetyl-CoA-carboxylase] ligase
MSVVLRPKQAPGALGALALAAALPVAEAVEALGIAGVQLKWPNDVLVAGRKVAGILCEAAAEGGRVRHAVVGIGVNVNVARFPSALRARADSLHRLRGRSVDRAGFVVDLCRRLETWMDRFEEHGAAPVLAAWKARGRFGAVTVELPEGTLRGVAEDLEPDGALRVRREDGSYAVIRTGEIVG